MGKDRRTDSLPFKTNLRSAPDAVRSARPAREAQLRASADRLSRGNADQRGVAAAINRTLRNKSK